MSTPEDAISWARESGLITGNEELALSRIANLERRNSELTAELEDLRQFKKEVDGEGVVPATRVLDKERQVSELTARIAELTKERDDERFVNEDYRKSIANLEAALAEARKDSARIDAIIANKWTITWNTLRDSFIVQSKDQVCGNIGHSKPLRELLDALPSTPHPETEGTI